MSSSALFVWWIALLTMFFTGYAVVALLQEVGLL